MKELAKLRIVDADPRIQEVPPEKRDEKIELIYSLGYVYDPYYKKFFNPFINGTLKATVVYNFNVEQIENLHQNLEDEYLGKNQNIRSLEEIENALYKNEKITMAGNWIDSLSGILGLILLVCALIFHALSKIEVVAGMLLGSFILITLYASYNRTFAQNEDEHMLSLIWRKYQSIFLILAVALYPYLYYILYLMTDSYWTPIIIIIPIRYVVFKYVIMKLSKSYWQGFGINHLRFNSEENGH